MRLLVFNWGYTCPDMLSNLTRMGVSFDTVGYQFADKNHDDFFVHRFSKYLQGKQYDAVLSVNFFPLIAECCAKFGIKYLAWSYDNPLNVPEIERTLGYGTNYVFLFDREQAEHYKGLGFDNIYHLPLAVDTDRLDRIVLTQAEHARFDADVSFVGKLYDSDLMLYKSAMNDFQRGYIDAAIKVQGQLYGAYLLNQVITDEFVDDINRTYRDASPGVTMTKEALEYAMAAQTTREERLLLLALIASHHELKLYSREQNELLKNAKYMGSCGYLEEMPRVFKASKINLNITLKILKSGIPLRALDIMGAGGFLLSNWQPEIAENFADGEEVVLYESVEDAYDKADFYLKHEDLRNEIAAKGHMAVSERFSYKQQLGKIFDISGVGV